VDLGDAVRSDRTIEARTHKWLLIPKNKRKNKSLYKEFLTKTQETMSARSGIQQC
jgi:hypothetical protein